MKTIIFNTGHCIGPAKVACASKKWKKVRFQSRAFLISTKKYGNILFDTGYAAAYCQNVSPIYDWILPSQFSSEQNIINQLDKRGFSLSDISYIFISHFHVDHIAGLKSLKKVPWIYRKDILEDLLNFNRIKAFKHGFFKDLMPAIPKGSIPINQGDFKHFFMGSYLKSSYLFDDPKIQIIDLPGHALGQMGLYFQNSFFIADATWSEESLYEGVLPSRIGLFLQHDSKAYIHTFKQIQGIKKRFINLLCIPTHKVEDL